MVKTLVTGSLQASEEDLARLTQLGLDITYHKDERVPVENAAQYEIVVGNSVFYYQDCAPFTSLKFMQMTSAGYDRIPVERLKAQGVILRNADGVYSPPMAEWTLMRILELTKHAKSTLEAQQQGVYKKDWKWGELVGKKALIVGFGAYGRAIAKRLAAFDAAITIVNRTVRSCPEAEHFYGLDHLEEEIPKADYVILAIALNEETRHLFDRDMLARIKPGAFLINAARGALIDEAALIEALSSGQLAAAALDVYEKEPLSADSPLWKLDNVLLSQHNSFVGDGNHARMMDLVIRNLKEYLNR
ncbi:MAG: hypothetical protein II882_07605 [Lachnospiraceae bacterium]|nr:hypothetical protein [Lachnospiraceae bacterium]